MSNLATAIAIAANGFINKTDKAGEPYIMHCFRVMRNLHSRDEELQCIAMLHDTVEDDIITIKTLGEYRFSDRVIRAIMLLTHDRDNKSYDDYIKDLANNPDARLVKLADLKDNSDITRLKGLTKKDFDRMEKYHKAYTYLSNV